MKTVRTFNNAAQAGLACSVLRSADIYAVLADLNAFTLGPQYVPWGIRLQVADGDEDEAERVLDHREGFPPLPDDFVPPPELFQESAPPAPEALRAFDAFLSGGTWAVAIFTVFVVVNLATDRPTHADPGGIMVLFALGGIVGLAIAIHDNKRRKKGIGK